MNNSPPCFIAAALRAGRGLLLSVQLLWNCLMLINKLEVERTIEREDLQEQVTADDLHGLTPVSH
ncbi:MAG: hypothetical protein JSR31_14935 [Nitrospira sp.]|nr:hypothetical protein [Nitrospira sp.]